MFGQALIIDDRQDYVDGISKVRSSEFEYLFVTDPKSALYLLYEYDVDHVFEVVACNANMRSGDVFEFIRSLKNDPHLSELPVIAYCVTKDLNVESLRSVAEALGTDELIASSAFDASTVCNEIERWLSCGNGVVEYRDPEASDN